LWIAGAGELAGLALRARRAARVAVDTEADSLHSYFHKVCLIQLSFADTHALIDPLAVGRDGLAPVAELLADPAVTKLFHGADYDLRVLDRDLGARAVNVRDTQIAAQLLGLPQTGLAPLLAAELGVILDKGHQRADWGQRPLLPELIAYAIADTAHLQALEARLARRLAELDRLAWWEEECTALEAIRWEPPVADELAFERVKGAGRLRGGARDRLAALHRWRE
jgi:ribonuclease D